MTQIVLPGQGIQVDEDNGVDPVWYEKLQQMAGALNGGIVGQGTLATTAVSGFGYISTAAGPPTGVPTPRAGYAAFVYDTVNNKLWVYNGAWRGVVLT
jgi:hypothetical protein